MNLEQYLERKRQLSEQEKRFRELCLACRQPGFGCFCAQLKSIDCPIEFVILIHSIEAKRRIATGRMAHLSLKNSFLVPGCDYSQHPLVNEILSDPSRECVMLYPGRGSIDIGKSETSFRASAKKLTVFVVDGTWATARKMVRLSTNLHVLPRICFTPPAPSNFRVRKQPKAECYSTIEAIHHTIELLGESRGFSVADRSHDQLLQVFDWMVTRQLEFIETSRAQGPSRYRREREKRARAV